ncbi:MAG: M28 family peptidase [Gemmataceae bacterium]|nr:M28 family peptidase [Gemmataceae bacterium]
MRIARWVVGAVGAAAVACGGLAVWWHVSPATAGPELNPDDPPKPSGFAADAPKPVDLKFDPERALKYLKQLCDLGSRVSGTEGMRKQQDLLEAHFKEHGAAVTRQEFQAKQHSRRDKTPMANLVISWNPAADRRVLICSHYDTRPIADQEANRASWNRPFASANDGTSGAALMMELAHHMKGLKGAVGVDFVLFDGEEYVFETNRTGAGGDKYFFGSEHFADDYLKTRNTRKHRYEAGVLLDLFSGKDAKLKVEQYSYAAAPKLVDQVWGVAAAVGAKSFRYEAGYEVQDDHLALNRAGIPCVDVIDFDYPHWHKLTDTPDKVSGDQMAEVAKVLATWWTGLK